MHSAFARVERGMAALERGVGEMDRTKQVVLLTDKLLLSPEQASALSGIELSSEMAGHETREAISDHSSFKTVRT
jgi:hypothetical protein